METLRVQLEEKKAKLVRKKAMEVYGHSKGSISKAIDSALNSWLNKVSVKKGKIKAEELTGIVSDLKDSSIKAQQKAVKLMARAH